jgi:hypothetical protein
VHTERLDRTKRDEDLANLKKAASKKPTQNESKFKSSNGKLSTNVTSVESSKLTTVAPPTTEIEDGFLGNFTATNATIDVSLALMDPQLVLKISNFSYDRLLLKA